MGCPYGLGGKHQVVSTTTDCSRIRSGLCLTCAFTVNIFLFLELLSSAKVFIPLANLHAGISGEKMLTNPLQGTE